jgi:DNA-binding response OmpR family regulator
MPQRVNARVLLVDDEKSVTDTVGAYLEEVPAQSDSLDYRYDYHVEVAYSGEEALDKAAKFAPHLVVLDWILPGISGQQVCYELRRNGNALGIIMLTQKTELQSERQMLVGACRVDDYVRKPYTCEVLEARIQAVLDRYHPEQVRLPCLISEDNQVYLNPNPDRREARFDGPDGTMMAIRDERFILLYRLMLKAQECIPSADLLQKVWKGGGNRQVLNQAISVLRQEMYESADNAHYILSCGDGYCFGHPVRAYRCP